MRAEEGQRQKAMRMLVETVAAVAAVVDVDVAERTVLECRVPSRKKQ